MIRFTAFAAAALVCGLAGIAPWKGTDAPQGVDREQTSAIGQTDEHVFRMRSPDSEGGCLVRRGRDLVAGKAALTLEPGCAAVAPGIEKARYWVEKPDGSVLFSDDGAQAILTFAIADGVAYESLDAARPIISLDAAGGDGPGHSED